MYDFWSEMSFFQTLKVEISDVPVSQTIAATQFIKIPYTAEPIRATENYLKSPIIMMLYTNVISRSPIYLVSMKFFIIFEVIFFFLNGVFFITISYFQKFRCKNIL